MPVLLTRLENLAQSLYCSDGETVLNADQSIDINSAIAAFTINGARLMQHDDQLGSIETGKTADLVVLSDNIVTLAEGGEPYHIAGTKVTMTVFDGKVVYRQ